MGTFDQDRDAMDATFLTAEERTAYLLDGQAPPPPSPVAGGTFSAPLASPAAVASASIPQPAAADAADAGPGVWSRLGTAAQGLVGKVASAIEAAKAAQAAKVGAAPVAAPAAAAMPPPQQVPWKLILGVVAAVAVVVAILRR